MIDSGLVAQWDPEVVQAVGRFEQGDLVERPPFFYAGCPSSGVWATTRAFSADTAPGETIVIELDPADCPPFGILTSQGCDIADTVRKPWVQIAPVYPAGDLHGGDGRLADVRRDAVPHLILLEPPQMDGLWIADFRIEVPVEKSWLAGKQPIQGFATEEARRRFARRLAGRLVRPALPDVVHDVVVRPLRRLLDRANTTLRGDLSQAAIEFRLTVRSHPDDTHECRLLVVGREPIPPSVEAAIQNWWLELPKGSEKVTVLDSKYCTTDELTMREYLGSELLDDRWLSDEADAA